MATKDQWGRAPLFLAFVFSMAMIASTISLSSCEPLECVDEGNALTLIATTGASAPFGASIPITVAHAGDAAISVRFENARVVGEDPSVAAVCFGRIDDDTDSVEPEDASDGSRGVVDAGRGPPAEPWWRANGCPALSSRQVFVTHPNGIEEDRPHVAFAVAHRSAEGACGPDGRLTADSVVDDEAMLELRFEPKTATSDDDDAGDSDGGDLDGGGSSTGADGGGANDAGPIDDGGDVDGGGFDAGVFGDGGDVDSGAPDGVPDGGSASDGGQSTDAGGVDDAGVIDAGPVDAGDVDGGDVDAGDGGGA